MSFSEKSFKIINAGFCKTGSKSCTLAMEILGYKTADFCETLAYFSNTWMDYIDGKIPIEAVIAEYNKHGFAMNNDM